MQLRFFKVLALVSVLAAAFAGVARALDFNDEDIPPPPGEVGAVYYFKVGAHSGCLPYHFVVDSGELPPGLTLSDLDYSTGLVSGVPTESGTFSAWLSLHDCAGKSAQDLFEWDIAPRTWGIKTTSLPPAVLGAPYSTKLQAGDRPVTVVTWKVTSGALPAGLTLGNDGTISGTPTAPGSSTFTITATSSDLSSQSRVDSRQFTIDVVSLTATASRQTGEVRVPFTSTLIASGGTGPYTWTASGITPPGLSVATNGVISGVPTHSGSFTLALHVVDATGAARDLQVTLVVRPRVAISASRLPRVAAGHAYRANVSVRGGVAPFRWSLARGTLPRGLTLAARTGTIAGSTKSSGTFRITVRVRDALGAAATKAFVLIVR